MTDPKVEFRKRLVASLKKSSQNFSFKDMVEECHVSREIADDVAARLVLQVFLRCAQDGVISDGEQAKLDRLMRRLEIPPKKGRIILERSARFAFRKELDSARADGVVTEEERQQLEELRTTLGLRKDKVTCECECGVSFRSNAAESKSVVTKCPVCGWIIDVRKRIASATEEQLACPRCSAVMFPDSVQCLACGYQRLDGGTDSAIGRVKGPGIVIEQTDESLLITCARNLTAVKILVAIVCFGLILEPELELPFLARFFPWSLLVFAAYGALISFFNKTTVTFSHNLFMINGGPVPWFDGGDLVNRPVGDIVRVFVQSTEETTDHGTVIWRNVMLLMKDGTKEDLVRLLALDGSLQLAERIERFLYIDGA